MSRMPIGCHSTLGFWLTTKRGTGVGRRGCRIRSGRRPHRIAAAVAARAQRIASPSHDLLASRSSARRVGPEDRTRILGRLRHGRRQRRRVRPGAAAACSPSCPAPAARRNDVARDRPADQGRGACQSHASGTSSSRVPHASRSGPGMRSSGRSVVSAIGAPRVLAGHRSSVVDQQRRPSGRRAQRMRRRPLAAIAPKTSVGSVDGEPQRQRGGPAGAVDEDALLVDRGPACEPGDGGIEALDGDRGRTGDLVRRAERGQDEGREPRRRDRARQRTRPMRLRRRRR